MSAVAASRSVSAILLANAFEYQCPATKALGKSRNTSLAPALPNTAELAEHDRAVHTALIRIVTVLLTAAPHLLAAARKTFIRCCPSVVPGFPPTGATAVLSLNPTPAGSPFMIVRMPPPPLPASMTIFLFAPCDPAAPGAASVRLAFMYGNPKNR